MSRGRSPSPRTLNNANGSDAEMRSVSPPTRTKDDSGLRVVVVSNLTRNVVEAHLRTIFSFYGEIKKIDIPLFAKSGQNRGKAALEFHDSSAAQKATSHMNKGYLDGAILNVQLSDAILRDRSRSRSPRPPRNGRGVRRSPSRSLSPRRRPPPASRDKERDRGVRYRRYSPPARRSPLGRRAVRGSYRPRSGSRSRSPLRRGGGRRSRRSPSYERGGVDYRSRRSRSRSSYSLASSRSRSRSRSYDSRSRSRSYSSVSRRSGGKSRTRSIRSSRSRDRDDIRDSRSRSRSPP